MHTIAVSERQDKTRQDKTANHYNHKPGGAVKKLDSEVKTFLCKNSKKANNDYMSVIKMNQEN